MSSFDLIMRRGNRSGSMTVLKFLAAFAGLLGLAVLFAIYYGFALSILWGWFVVPVFHVQHLTTNQCAGLFTTLWFALSFISVGLSSKPNDPDNSISVIISVILGPLLAVALGFVLRLFVGM